MPNRSIDPAAPSCAEKEMRAHCVVNGKTLVAFWPLVDMVNVTLDPLVVRAQALRQYWKFPGTANVCATDSGARPAFVTPVARVPPKGSATPLVRLINAPLVHAGAPKFSLSATKFPTGSRNVNDCHMPDVAWNKVSIAPHSVAVNPVA